MQYKVLEVEDGLWSIFKEHPVNISGAKGYQFVCDMTSDEILELFNQTVPRTVEEPFLIGREDCKHSWRPWKFNSAFIICNNCPAMKKVKRLVPRKYE